jgi:predicted TPR repeat methyltransferase
MSATTCASTMATSKEHSMRERIEERPRNARARAQLACYLNEQAKGKREEDPKKGSLLQSEATHLAEQAIEIAPSKPFGYAALSEIHSDHHERMNALRKAIQFSDGPSHLIAKIFLMVRLLVEPRNICIIEQRRCALKKEETLLYDRIKQNLEQAWTSDRLGESDIAILALREYRLGLFFRRMIPLNKYRPRAQAHFQSTYQHLPAGNRIRSLAQFWLATIDETKQASLTKCPEDYIVGLYSTFAATFDDLLVGKLAYKTPDHLRQLLDQTVCNDEGPKWRAAQAADLGCGTGLSGLAFRDCVTELVGVDLSPEMIALARRRDCYERLVVGDVMTILSPGANFSLVLSCDVFVYLGDLMDVFARVHESLSPGGLFAFSTELLDESDEQPYRLHACARFAHKKSYIESLATANGFKKLSTKVCPIRKNAGRDVAGLLVVLAKAG